MGDNTRMARLTHASKSSLFLSVYVDEMASKKKNKLEPHVEKLMIKIDLEEQTRITDQIYLECTQR